MHRRLYEYGAFHPCEQQANPSNNDNSSSGVRKPANHYLADCGLSRTPGGRYHTYEAPDH